MGFFMFKEDIMKEPVKCRCGKKADVHTGTDWQGQDGYWVKCIKQDCWSGKAYRTRYGAVNAWNSVMRRLP